ncbi:MAG: serine/threonine-protein kinase, partial [Planctomycetota bacterium]
MEPQGAEPRQPPQGRGGQPPPAGSRAEEDLALARVAMERGLVDAEQVRTCLQIQADLAALGNAVPLGQLLIRRRLIDIETFVSLAQEVRERAVRCPGCRTLSLLPAGGRTRGGRGRCASCGASFSFPSGRPEPGAAAAKPARPEPSAEPPRPAAAPPPEADADREAPASRRRRRRRHASLTGKRFGSCEVLDEIARGGMGVVYRARDHARMRIVALKVLKDGAHASEKQVRRFRREVATVRKLKHPNIVQIFDVGETDGQHWFTMEWIDGHALDEVLRRGPLPIRRSFEIIEQVARAIHHAHEHGVIHRDLKPANILLDRRGVPMITDFGLAKNVDHTSAMTKTGAAVGTPFYMPPEQARGDAARIDRRVDVYALGVLLYEMTTGELPFDGDTNVEVYRKIMELEPVPPSRLDPRFDPAAERVILKAMAKEREDRYASALELADDLRRWLDGHGVLAQPPSRVRRIVRTVRRRAPVWIGGGGAVAFVIAVVVSVWVVDTRSARRQERQEARAEFDAYRRRLGSIEREASAALLRARAALRDGTPEEAIAVLDPAIEQLREIERWPDALRFARHNRDRLEALLDPRAHWRRTQLRDLWLARAEAADALGGPDRQREAERALEEAARLDPDAAAVQLAYARWQLRHDRLEAAVKRLDTAIAHDPDDTEARLLRAQMLLRLGRFDRALADASHAERIARARSDERGPARYRAIGSERSTPLAQALLVLARCLARTGDPREALAPLDEILDADPGHFEAVVLRSRLRLRAGALKGAIEDAEAAIEIHRDRPDGFVALARIEIARGHFDRAEQRAREALARDPHHGPAALLLGWILELRGRGRAALDLYTQASERRRRGDRPRARALAWLRRAERKRLAGQAEAAEIAYGQAVAILPRLLAAELGRARR